MEREHVIRKLVRGEGPIDSAALAAVRRGINTFAIKSGPSQRGPPVLVGKTLTPRYARCVKLLLILTEGSGSSCPASRIDEAELKEEECDMGWNGTLTAYLGGEDTMVHEGSRNPPADRGGNTHSPTTHSG